MGCSSFHEAILLAQASPFRLVDRCAEWPRLAGVTSVGIGGTNVHVVLAEAPRRVVITEQPGAEVLPLSARTPVHIAVLARALADVLRAEGAPSLSDVAHTLRTGRTSLPVRTYVVAVDRPMRSTG